MTIKSKTCYWVECEAPGCGPIANCDGFEAHFDSADEAVARTPENDTFTTSDGRHFCVHCIEGERVPADVLEERRVHSESVEAGA